MKVGDIVMVKTNSFVDKHSRIFSDIRPHFYKGIVEFVSDRWATVMLFSNNTKAPMYRQSFWKEDIFVKS